jgi:Predicted ATPases
MWVYRWFKDRFWVFDMSEQPMNLLFNTTEHIKRDEDLRSKTIALMGDADFGIEDMKMVDPPSQDETDLPPGYRRVIGPDGNPRVVRVPRQINVRTIHRGSDGSEVEFAFPQDESIGTQRVFAMSGPLLRAISIGALVVIDEFDCSMHPHLARSLIQFFHRETGIASHAQMILATHDATLFDKDVFRRDELWLVDKHASGRSVVYSLHDFATPPRSDAAFQKGYMSGKYGGVPHFGELLERYSSKSTSDTEQEEESLE